MTVLDAIRSRRSIKSFADRTITRTELETLLDLAVLAPNHRMTEPWGFIVLGPEARRAYGRIKGDSRAERVDDAEAAEVVRQKTIAEMESLPVVIAFTQRLDPYPEIREEDFATVYMGMQNVLLGAVAMGLGTHVKTGALLDSAEVRMALGVEEGERLVALVHLGEPAETREPKPRAPAVERTRWLP